MRCSFCKKKTHITFACTCEGCKHVLCITCRMPEIHKCDFVKKKIVLLPKIVSSKIEKI